MQQKLSAPSLNTLELLAVSDNVLFEHHMKRIGLEVIGVRDENEIGSIVQSESITAIASIITEDSDTNVELDSYRQRAKKMAENCGYIITINQNTINIPICN